ncbi:ATP-grasp domain-containing protein [Thalassobellus suaedae]|uniref:ATP-grasp domain-containing protein n=1 Tax=Thalassobellus suaedae TaxID=3074124 RepID=A0ABY9XWP8_9FLAO|nr:ATP-grasp domain-containing protein [Flavobacteriaceae bacterium HL-DH14]
MNILITSAGRRVSLVKAFKNELKKLVPISNVFTVDYDPELSAACYESDKSFPVPKAEDLNYIDSLLNICIENDIKLIIPTIDTELLVLSKNKNMFLDKGIIIIVSSVDFVLKCRDKHKIHDFFVKNNIQVAKEYSRSDYKFPLFLKPYDGSRSVDNFIIKRKEDLNSMHLENEKLMFLEYLDQDLYEEFTCDMYYDKNNKLKCVVPRKRIEIRDGEVNKGITKKNIIIDFSKKHLSHINGAVGCLTVQFFKHKVNEQIIGIEINPRFGGGFPLTYLAGANYVKWILEEYLFNKEIDEQFDCWKNNLLMLRYDNEILVNDFKH